MFNDVPFVGREDGTQRAAAPAVGLLDGCGGVLRPPERAPAASGRKIFAKNRPAGEKTLSFLEQMG